MDKVSIIIPVYNRADLVSRTLNSVLQQTHRPLQLVLVDNGSTDNSLVVLNQFKIDHAAPDFDVVVASEPTHGACAARNCGFAKASAPWVMFFDSDDTMDKHLVERYVAKIKSCDGNLDMVVTRRCLIDENGKKAVKPYFKSDVFANHILHSFLATQSYIVRRDFFAKAGGWNTNLPVWNDWEMAFRLLLQRPRMAYLKGKPMVFVNSTGRASITGTCFHEKAGLWERSIDTIIGLIATSELKHKKRYLRLLNYRRLVLAAQYEREGHRELAEPLAAKGYKGFKHHPLKKLIMRRLYHRIASGRHGSARIARHVC